MIKTKNKTITVILSITLAVIIILETNVVWSLFKLKSNEKKIITRISSTLDRQSENKINIYSEVSSPEIEKTIPYLFDPALSYVYDKLTGGKSYQKSTFSLDLKAAQYIKGLRWPSGYEGIEWEESLDDVVNDYLQLKPGEQLIQMHVSGYLEEKNIELRKIGSRYYAVSNDPFHPSGSITRIYQTFDQKLNRIITITLTFYPGRENYSDSLTKEYLKKLYSRPEYSKAIQLIEQYLSKI